MYGRIVETFIFYGYLEHQRDRNLKKIINDFIIPFRGDNILYNE